jgi:hypothetical protein
MIGNVEIRPAEFQVLIEDATRRPHRARVRALHAARRAPRRRRQRPEIYSLMWGGEMPRRDRSVDVLIRRVRAKLEQVAPEWRYIHHPLRDWVSVQPRSYLSSPRFAWALLNAQRKFSRLPHRFAARESPPWVAVVVDGDVVGSVSGAGSGGQGRGLGCPAWDSPRETSLTPL